MKHIKHMKKLKSALFPTLLCSFLFQAAASAQVAYGYTNALRTYETIRGNIAQGGSLYPSLPNDSNRVSAGYKSTAGATTSAAIGQWTLTVPGGVEATSDTTGRSIEFYNPTGQGAKVAILRWTATDVGVVTTAQWVSEME